ncbi:MAG: substrate-binding domain-containing protein, partial [Candidatus Latescibacteria bacterium]|nr:substrate-binding domain-containing protein [Candidatus Latescibacterota bacterium]
ICNILLDRPSSIYAPVFEGIYTAAEKEGYSTILVALPGPPEEVRPFKQVVGIDCSDGVILWAGSAKIVEKFLPLPKFIRKPIVTINTILEGTNIPSVTLNNVRGGYLATHYLGELSHTRIGFIGGSNRDTFNDRFTGYKDALSELGLPYDESLITFGLGDLDSGFEEMKRLLAASMPPTAVFVTNDAMAVGAIKAILDEGMRVPDDMSVVGYDDASPSRYSIPPLTTIRQPMELMGQVAAELLIRLLQSDTDHRQDEGERIVIESELVLRDSCRAVTP